MWRLAVAGVGLGLFIGANQSLVLGAVSLHRLGMASGMLAQVRDTGQVLGVELTGYLSNMESSVTIKTDQLVLNGGVMKKGEKTRLMIVERAAPVFNTRGYYGSSMKDLVEETGLEKGGIYNHFVSKEDLAVAAFEYTVESVGRRFQLALEGKEGALARLYAVVEVFGDFVDGYPVAGGCPVLNTAVESDGTNPVLKEKAREAMTGWHRLIGSIVKGGVQRGELKRDANPYEVASLVTATLEGAIMLGKLYDDPIHMRRAVDHVKQYLGSLTEEEA